MRRYWPKFYVYEHWRPDKDVCFYVGKGKGGRAYHLKREGYHAKIVQKLARLGMCAEVRLVQYGLTEDVAFELEIQRIAFWKASGIKLANLTNGGEGAGSGKVWTKAELKHLGKAISVARIGMKFELPHCINLSKKKLGRKRKPFKKSTCRKIAIAASARRNTRPGTWDDGILVETLKLLHSRGLSARQIQEHMKLSRQTIIQKLYRLGLKLNPGMVSV